MRRALKLSVVVSLISLVTLAIVEAQSSVGILRGLVKDASGAVLPGVTVTMSRGGTATRTAITDTKGEFLFEGVTPGRYDVIAVLIGFGTERSPVTVSAGGIASLSFTLHVGQIAETITVSGQARTIDASAARTFNTETYDRINDNKWTNAKRRPLSTLSIDVDTASYSNVRRSLNQGQRPPKDAVRIEELINYFSFGYPEPRGGKPFAVTTTIGECPWNAKHRLALIGLQARRVDSGSMPPRNLVFLVDTSGSMFEPTKLPLVKASLAMLARNLTDRDRVAIVAYAGEAGLVLPATSGADVETIVEAISRLESGGSTNGAGGIVLAYQIARQQFINGAVNRVVLSTDGDFNVGVTGQGDLIRLIEEHRESGIALSVLGFGMGNLKDSTMEKLADTGNGNYAYIDSLQEAQKVLVEQAGGTLVTVAKDVKLQVEFNPRVIGSYRLIGYEKRVLEDHDFNDDRKDAGDMGAGHSVTVLFELAPVGESFGTTRVDPLKYQLATELSASARADEAMTVKVRYKQPDGNTSTLTTVAVKNTTSLTPELGFASAVAEFGMLLRESEHKGSSSFADVRERANRFKGDDPYGHRAEFVRLVDAAEGVGRVNR
ncbi:MAG TPA: von Willebrand factor type A domain-containing protein [Vicinamibacterales bacterium]|nr:von Willebrand factor type A domain-containing protein [Vicinamibacterales bacterium]